MVPLQRLQVGDPAPGFDLPTLGVAGDESGGGADARPTGGRLRLEDLRGRPVILTFLRHAG